MNLITNLDIETELKKVNALIAKYEELEKHNKQLHFITIKEFAKLRGCSIKIAQDLFNLPDFPSENFGKEKVILLEALKEWYMTKRDKNNYE